MVIKNKIQNKKSRKSQVTVFIIIALIIVVAAALVFSFKRPAVAGEISLKENPQAYIQKCAIDAYEIAEQEIIPHGGFADPPSSILYENVEVVWMCYTSENEQICTNVHPMLSNEMEREILGIITPKIEKCFADLKNQFSGYDYQASATTIGVNIRLTQVLINIRKDITITKNGQTQTFSSFDTSTISPLYEFISITNTALNQEVDCNCGEETCNADIFGLNRQNNNFETSRFVTARNEKVYTIKEIDTGKKFNFAVRNCVRMP